jgi:hypothetical protein
LPDLGREVVQHVDTFKGAPGARPAEVGLGVDNPGCTSCALVDRTRKRPASHGPHFFYRGVSDQALEQLAPYVARCAGDTDYEALWRHQSPEPSSSS